MKKSFVLLVSSFITCSALAGTMGPQASSWGWIGALNAGPVWVDGGRTQTFYLTPTIEKTYVANQSIQALFDGEIFLGLQKMFSQTLQGYLGLEVAATSNAALSGIIWDDADPEFDNYIYNYKIRHTHIVAKGKLLVNEGYWLIPFVSASIGVAFNSVGSFNSTPTLFEALPTPGFSSHTQTAFTYALGIGVQKALNQHWQVGVGYEFADWGKSNLGRAQEQTLNTGLALNHFYTNGLMFNVTYLA